MGLDELSDAQQKLLHPLLKLKHRTSHEAVGTLVELLGDITRLYQGFAQGMKGLELKVDRCSFMTGMCDQNSSESLRAIRGDIQQADVAVIAITKEQRGMAAVWTALRSFVARVHHETNEFVAVLNSTVADPLNTFYDGCKDSLTDSVEDLQMDDVMNFIPNLKILKQSPGFNHCGARKYVENVLKSYKDLHHCLENEKELIAEGSGTSNSKSQAKAMNKTVKAKMSLGKHIQQLFEVAPEMKVLVSRVIPKETFEQLATLKLVKAASPVCDSSLDAVAFHSRFCKLEKRRLSIFSSCLQIWVDALVKYNSNSYNNLREVYQAIVDFSPESDYGQFEALVLGAQVSHIAKHSRVPGEVWLTSEFTQLEDFKRMKDSNVCLIMHQPVELDRFDDDSETVIDSESVELNDDTTSLLQKDADEQHVDPDHPLITTSFGDDSCSESVAESASIETPSAGFESSSNAKHVHFNVEDIRETEVVDEEQVAEANNNSEGFMVDSYQCDEAEANLEGTLINEPVQSIVPQALPMNDRKSHKRGEKLWTRSATLLRGRRGGSHKRASSTETLRAQTFKSELPLPSDDTMMDKYSIRRSASVLPSVTRDIHTPLRAKHDKKEKQASSGKKDEKKETRKESRGDSKKRSGSKKRSNRNDKAPLAVMTDGIQCDASHFSSSHPNTPKKGIEFDFDSYKSARDILEETLRRSDMYFQGLNSYCALPFEKSFSILDGDLNGLMAAVNKKLVYPFEMHNPFGLNGDANFAPSVQNDLSTFTMSTNSVDADNSHEGTLRRLFRLPFSLNDSRIDSHQWNLLALEQLVLLHRYISGFMTHPCLSSDSETTFRDFLLTNLGVIEHMVTRVRNFIQHFKNYSHATTREFEVMDILLTPRDTFVSTSPHVDIHMMDVRYRLMLMIDAWHKNDIPLLGTVLFDSTEFYDFLYRQIFLVKLSFVQKLARVVRRIPVIGADTDQRWIDAMDSVSPSNILDIKFQFPDNPKVDRISNKILLILCECVGHLNILRNVVEQRQWGEESVCDSNYMSARDQLIQVLNMTVQLDDLDNELMQSLGIKPESSEPFEFRKQSTSSSNLGNPFKMTSEELTNVRYRQASTSRLQTVGPSSTDAAIQNAPQIRVADASDHFCTAMSIFDDDEISLLKRVDTRRGCFGRCGSRRMRRRTDPDAIVNPYFILPVDVTELSGRWKLDDSVIMRLAVSYHQSFSSDFRYGDWSMNFATVEYAIYFISTGYLLNFMLYKERCMEYRSNICTLYHALLSTISMMTSDSLSKKPAADDVKCDRLDTDGLSEKCEKVKDVLAILQVPLNIAVLPKVLGDIDLYLQLDLSSASTSNIAALANQGAPEYSSLQMGSFIGSTNIRELLAASKMQFGGMQLNRASGKVHRLVIDSIRHNVPQLCFVKPSDSISLIEASQTEQMVLCILMLRVFVERSWGVLYQQLMDFTLEQGSDILMYMLSTFVLVNRLVFPNELTQCARDGAGPLDICSIFEVRERELNMDMILRRVIVENAKTVVDVAFAKIDQYKIDGIDDFSATVMECIVGTIREYMALSSVWDEFLPIGDFSSLFTNACIAFFKMHIRRQISRPLDICVVMAAAHKMRVLQREIETSRLVKLPTETQQDDLMHVLKFAFNQDGDSSRNLLSHEADLMEIIGLTELERKLASFREIINRSMKREDWVRLGSQYHTRAVVDLATVLNATFKATLDLKVPFGNLLMPLTSSLESTLNHYFTSITEGKVADQVNQALEAFQDATDVDEKLRKFSNNFDIERGLLQMGNMIYLGQYLSDVQDTLLQYCHRILTERCEDSDQLHKDLATDMYRDSSKFFMFELADLQGMKELSLVPASKRLIQRQCDWHVQTLAKFYSLRALRAVIARLHEPAATSRTIVSALVDSIRGLCTEFSKLGSSGRKAMEALFEIAFCCIAYVIRVAGCIPQEASLLKGDLQALQLLASEHQQDVSELLESAFKHIQ
ncbi:hypothetical protein X943_000734 [Babesia divergens]|uniref:Uncharacterized protein n=1 Tax=Babesia divergens TaxID=32595 RepID=A0AAD9GH63_BABDI|nr:hypothetical protein X943_000734 [Babesia divergens]